MNWRLAPTIGLVAVLAPAMAHAQTNIDQGKSASQIFAARLCRMPQGTRGLAKGKNSAALTDFLREHYTTSRDQAAALAAYVLGGRGAEPVGGTAQGKGPKPATERAERGAALRRGAQEPKPTKRQARQSKPEEGTRAEAKSDAKSEVKPRYRTCSWRTARRPRRREVIAKSRGRPNPRSSPPESPLRLLRLWQSPRRVRRRIRSQARRRHQQRRRNFGAGRCRVRRECSGAA